jgi:hypothetical protein
MIALKPLVTLSTFALAATACAPEQTPPPDPAANAKNIAEPSTADPTPPAARAASQDAPAPANVLTLEGLGALRIGAAVPPGSSWAERGAQISDTCRLLSSPDYPGAYAIVEGGKVRRITLGERSAVKLVEGIVVGASEAEVRAAFPGFNEAPHFYVEAPAKYLTAPNAESGDPALRFETGADAKVTQIHVGTMPVLGYVEGCA